MFAADYPDSYLELEVPAGVGHVLMVNIVSPHQTIPTGIYSLKYLRVLDMSKNLLSTLPEDIGRLKGLKVLRLSGNSFERVPPTIGHLAHLTELDMSRNRIRRLPPEIKGKEPDRHVSWAAS